jgi:hypothetical protein
MKKTSVLPLIAIAVFPVVFSSCSSLASNSAAQGTSTASASTSIADHEHFNAAAMGYENNWPFGQNGYR